MLQSFCKPAPGLQHSVRFYTQRQMKIDGPGVVHPVTARAIPMLEFELGEPINAFYHEDRSLKKSPVVTVVAHRHIAESICCFAELSSTS